MQLTSRQWLILGAAAAGGALLALWWPRRNSAGGVLDTVIDAVVELTSSDEDRLQQLEPTTQAQVRALIQQLADQGIAVHVGQTLRSSAQEKADIALGRSSKDLKISWHQIGRAVDLYPINPDTGSADYDGARDDLFQAMVAAARGLGFRSLAYEADGTTRHYITTTKGQTWDGGHLEWRAPYATIAEAVAAEGAAYGLA